MSTDAKTECERTGEHQFFTIRNGFRQPTNACQRPGCGWFRGVETKDHRR